MTLFVNSCVRKGSRTKRLAGILLGKLGGEIEEINVSDITFPTVDEEFLKKRDGLIASNKWDDPLFKYARQFAEDYGFGYVKALAQGFYGIQDVRLIKATGLDIYGADVEGIMQDAIASIDSVLQ